VSLTHQQIADELGISRSTLRKRLIDMSLEEAIRKPKRVKGAKSSTETVQCKCPKCGKLFIMELDWPWVGSIPARKFCPSCYVVISEYLDYEVPVGFYGRS